MSDQKTTQGKIYSYFFGMGKKCDCYRMRKMRAPVSTCAYAVAKLKCHPRPPWTSTSTVIRSSRDSLRSSGRLTKEWEAFWQPPWALTVLAKQVRLAVITDATLAVPNSNWITSCGGIGETTFPSGIDFCVICVLLLAPIPRVFSR